MVGTKSYLVVALCRPFGRCTVRPCWPVGAQSAIVLDGRCTVRPHVLPRRS